MTINSLPPVTGTAFLGSSPVTEAAAPAAPATGGPDFASVMADLASQTASSVKTGEEMAIKGIQGLAPLQDVVQSVMRAQTSLQTAIALRDKAVSAYQDLTRMPI